MSKETGIRFRPVATMPPSCASTYVLKRRGNEYVLARYGEEKDSEEEEERGETLLDSVESNEFQDLAQKVLLWRRDFVVDPEGDTTFLWTGVIACVMVYNMWALILRVAFAEMRQEALACYLFCGLDLVADMLYLVDMGMQFRMGYLEEGIVVTDPVKLAAHYMRERRLGFCLDLLAAIPLANLLGLVFFLPESIWLPLLRMPKLFKWHRLSHFMNTWDMKTSSPTVHRACKLLVYLATTIHWIGCMYYMISAYEGLGTNEWVIPVPSEKDGPAFVRKYLCSVYWSTMTLTTIGNDASPDTNLEYVFTGCTFLIGVFLFATVVGNVGDVISNMNAAKVDFQQKMDAIKMYMKHHQIPGDVQDRVKKWAEYSWNRTHAMDDQSHLDILPFRLKAEIAKHVHLDTLQKVKIFEECEKGLLCELVVRLRSQIYSPADYICRKGEIGREMYIINHGKVEVLVTDLTSGESTVVATLTEGNYFGEIALLKLEEGCNRRTADVRSVGYSELLVLSKRDLHAALVEYPDARQALERQARDRMNQSKEAIRLQRTKTERSLRVTGDPNLDEEGEEEPDLFGDRRGERVRSRSKEKEMGELRHLLYELKTFDSQATKSRVQDLTIQCSSLEAKLNQKSRELNQALSKIAQLQLQISTPSDCTDSSVHKELASASQGRQNGSFDRDDSLDSEPPTTSRLRSRSSTSGVNRRRPRSKSTTRRSRLIRTQQVCDNNEINSPNKVKQSSVIIVDKTVTVTVPGISVNDELIQEPQTIQMVIRVPKPHQTPKTPSSGRTEQNNNKVDSVERKNMEMFVPVTPIIDLPDEGETTMDESFSESVEKAAESRIPPGKSGLLSVSQSYSLESATTDVSDMSNSDSDDCSF